MESIYWYKYCVIHKIEQQQWLKILLSCTLAYGPSQFDLHHLLWPTFGARSGICCRLNEIEKVKKNWILKLDQAKNFSFGHIYSKGTCCIRADFKNSSKNAPFLIFPFSLNNFYILCTLYVRKVFWKFSGF